MSKVVLLTDTHFGVRNDSMNFARYFKQFYETVFFPYLEENNITRIIHLGDIFDRRKYINYRSLWDARRYFFEPSRAYQIDLILGNHDTSFKNTNEINSPDLLLRDYPNIRVHEHATDIEIDGTKIALLPWVCSDNYLSSMEYLQKTKAQILMGHLEIRGFEMHAGSLSDTGFDENLFKKFDRVFSGHFHHRSTRNNITYLGSPYEMTWQDYNDERGFHVFDTETRQLTFVQNPLSIFYKIFYEDTDTEAMDRFLAEHNFDKYAHTHVKIVIKERTDPFMLDRLVEKVENVQPIDLAFVDNTVDMMFQEEIDDDDIEDTASIIASMVESVPKKSIREPLKALMLDLHREAVNLTSI